nr:MAG TPA: hypothetical protein [Caudoviricetes sp.]
MPLFVHFVQAAQAPPALVRGGNFSIKKIVQNYASSCTCSSQLLKNP